jgi:hypothetical protein
MGLLRRLGLLRDRRHRGQRTPVFVGARLELDVVELYGTARDLGAGGVFFATSVPLAPGVRGTLTREGGGEPVTVRVSWRREGGAGEPAGLGLAFDPSYILIR